MAEPSAYAGEDARCRDGEESRADVSGLLQDRGGAGFVDRRINFFDIKVGTRHRLKCFGLE
jgi:hypothetical protein